MIDDVFCKILSGELKGDFVYRDDDVAVIRDINPQAPVHLLVMPVKHLDGASELTAAHDVLMGKLFRVAHQVASEQGLDKGYRLIVNEGAHGGKLVPHFHMHLLGGKPLGPKMVADAV